MSVLRSAISMCRKGYTCLFVQAAQRSNFRSFATAKTETDQSNVQAEKSDVLEIDDTDQSIISKGIFPTKEHLDMLVEGKPFRDIPVIHIKCTYNNTLITLQDGDRTVTNSSSGCVGFRNKSKSSNIAAQTVATVIAQKALFEGMKTVRVCVSGFGAGRLPAVKALETNGLNVISITDTTKLPFNGNRPRKQRRT